MPIASFYNFSYDVNVYESFVSNMKWPVCAAGNNDAGQGFVHGPGSAGGHAQILACVQYNVHGTL